MRRKLGDDAENPWYIKTVVGVGYGLLPSSDWVEIPLPFLSQGAYMEF